MIFQDPVGAFNPAKRIGWHLRVGAGARGSRGGMAASRRRRRCPRWASRIRASVLRRFPHQLSGGMLQRVLIAMVLALGPEVIIADEPTTNLDNIVERQILALFRELQRRLSSALVFITHDMTIAALISDRLAVMYAGQIVETGAGGGGAAPAAASLYAGADRHGECAGEAARRHSPRFRASRRRYWTRTTAVRFAAALHAGASRLRAAANAAFHDRGAPRQVPSL